MKIYLKGVKLVKLMSKPSAWPYNTVSNTENVKHKWVLACHKLRDNSFLKLPLNVNTILICFTNIVSSLY